MPVIMELHKEEKRYIIIGERSDMGVNYEYPKEMEKHYTVRDVIGSLPSRLKMEVIIPVFRCIGVIGCRKLTSKGLEL